MNYIIYWVSWNIIEPDTLMYNMIYYKDYDVVSVTMILRKEFSEWITGKKCEELQ